jgi:hypothetical protein
MFAGHLGIDGADVYAGRDWRILSPGGDPLEAVAAALPKVPGRKYRLPGFQDPAPAHVKGRAFFLHAEKAGDARWTWAGCDARLNECASTHGG